jgi:hypothetical protein
LNNITGEGNKKLLKQAILLALRCHCWGNKKRI